MDKTPEKMMQWLRRILDEKEIDYEVIDAESIRVKWKLYSRIQTIDNTIVAHEGRFHSFSDIALTAENKIPEVAEFLMRANWCLDPGHFYLDYDSGEISFELFSPYRNHEKDEDFDVLWETPIINFNWFGDGLLKVIFGYATAKAAYDECCSDE